MSKLKDRVALVTGASRGAGKGIALTLGSEGATVYVTGRSTGENRTEALPGTVEDTAAEIGKRGGIGIGIVCDHCDDSQVEAVFDRIRTDHGRLDLLVNNVWGGYEKHVTGLGMDPFWKLTSEHWDQMFHAGLRAHFTASRLAVPLMLPQKRGLIVTTIAWDRGKFMRHLYYDVVKSAIVRMTHGMSLELRPHNVAAVALAPGWLRSERILAAYDVKPFDLSATESTEYIGRAVAALAADPDLMRWSGQSLRVGDLAKEYGFTDIDGRVVPPFEMPEHFVLD